MNALLEVQQLEQLPALFEKRAIVELSPEEMMEIDGGTTPACIVGAYIACAWSGVQIGRAIYDATHADNK